jgi:hypothetical protein
MKYLQEYKKFESTHIDENFKSIVATSMVGLMTILNSCQLKSVEKAKIENAIKKYNDAPIEKSDFIVKGDKLSLNKRQYLLEFDDEVCGDVNLTLDVSISGGVLPGDYFIDFIQLYNYIPRIPLYQNDLGKVSNYKPIQISIINSEEQLSEDKYFNIKYYFSCNNMYYLMTMNNVYQGGRRSNWDYGEINLKKISLEEINNILNYKNSEKSTKNIDNDDIKTLLLELKELSELHKSGALTDDEFDKEKSKILSKL